MNKGILVFNKMCFTIGGTVSVKGTDGKEIQVDSGVLQQAVASQACFGIIFSKPINEIKIRMK